MEKRLKQIYDLIKPGKGVIDVGTDHAYLPVELALNGYEGRIIASDIKEGPLGTAKKHAEKYHVADKMTFTLCPGLDMCEPESVDTIVIAGMGGDMICSILDKAEWCMDGRYSLILQPMSRQEILRYWLCYNGFKFSEYLVHEGRFIYQIISAVYTGINSSCKEAELYTGKLEHIKNFECASQLLERETERLTRELRGLENSKRATADKINMYKTIVSQLIEMKAALS